LKVPERKKLLLLAEGLLINGLIDPLEATGCSILATSDVETAYRFLETENIQIVIVDLQIDAGRSPDILRKIRALSSDPLLLLLAPPWCQEKAVRALKFGAETFLTTPLHSGLVQHQVARLLEKKKMADENRLLRRQINEGERSLLQASVEGKEPAKKKRRGRGGSITPLKEALAAPERKIIFEALRACRFNRQKTAKALQINRTTLYNKMKRLGLLHLKGN
jgi:DNA-binding NtrC family response regulator